MTNENGRFPAELSITQGSTVIGTSNFIFNIERSPHPEGTIDGDAESLLPELTLLVERIEAAADSVDEDTQTVTEAKAEVLQAKADTLQAKADTLSARDDALQAKADTIAAKESAEASAQAAEESAQRAEDTLSDYAKVDGYYEEMAVGSAEQLLSSQFVEDSVPYKFRTSGGSKDIGNREYDEIVGGSIVWNQTVRRLDTYQSYTDKGITYAYDSAKNTLTVSGTATATTSYTVSDVSISLVKNHIYYFPSIKPSGSIGDYFINGYYNNYRGLFKYTGDNPENDRYVTLRYASGQTPNNEVFNVIPQIFDLTQMFGSTIADYIYSLETAEAGKGVAFFKSLFPNDYYPYNTGELLSVEGLQSHDTVGFNQFDIDDANLVQGNFDAQGPSYTLNVVTMNYTEVLPNTVYNLHDTIGSQGRYLQFYNDAKELVGTATQYNATDVTFTTPSNACYMKTMWYHSSGLTVAQVQNGNVCLNLSWSGWRNGEYEPYKKHSYALDSSLTLRGIPKLNAQNELYFDGDIYSHDGKVQRRYGIVDMGTLNWSRTASYSRGVMYCNLPLAKKGESYIIPNIKVIGYDAVPSSNASDIADAGDKKITFAYNNNQLLVTNDAYTDATAFKTAMSGVMLIYELATPTEETAEPYTSPQAVDDFGTEEYISGNVVPVGHNTKYPANLRDKLQHLPNMADSDGYYMISQQNKQMSLELFRIPKAPTTDGTYTLKATVSGGTPTYIWEAVE